jgi:hypothetical protein
VRRASLVLFLTISTHDSSRKLGFYLRRVAEKFRAVFNWGAAHYLMLLSAQCVKASHSIFTMATFFATVPYANPFQFDLGPLLPETFTGDGSYMLGWDSSGSSSGSSSAAANTSTSIFLGPSGWMGLKHCIIKDLKTIATGMNDGYKMILYSLMHIRMFYSSLDAEEQLKMCEKCRNLHDLG